MEIYGVSVDVDCFQTLVPSDDGVWQTDCLSFDGKPKLAWKAPEVIVFNPLKEMGDFYHLCPGAMVFTHQVREELADILEMAGQILDLGVIGGPDLYLLNVTECCNALDPRQTEWHLGVQTGRRIGIRKYAFRESVLSESSLFKVPESARGTVLAFSGVKAASDEFISRYRECGFRGLLFDLVYP